MSSNLKNTDLNNLEHSKPIPIATHNSHPRRSSDASFSSDSPPSSSSSASSNSPTSPFPSTPFTNSISGPPPRVAPLSPSTSPILSYFLSQSPKSPTTTFPFRRNFPPVLAEDDAEPEMPTANHHRRASMATWPERGVAPAMPSGPIVPISQPPTSFPEEQPGRAAGLLRRLSLGGALGRPQVPSIPKAPSPPTSPMTGHALERTATISGMPQAPASPSPRKARRSNTLAPGSARPPRAPSPMGERILKGHFDGFN
ncbi:hypothetical protein BXZ70DRAFT_1007927 [Cristinia sonorae]|uniref:Uncharacterized protein n=1 Tax=Cristinia sonorae TaxID=1940300 RepID=A0A8K0UQ73_9AGAR|nr:hypothetical protein BXZ70DRAFT_1007927 [Cristinia sonorae]